MAQVLTSEPQARGGRRRPSLLALATSALVVIAGLGIVPGTAYATNDSTVTGATLQWGVKASFRSYIYTNQPTIFKGRSTLLGNVTQPVAQGIFNWSGGSGAAALDGSTADVSYGVGNGVRFQAHPLPVNGQDVDVLDLSFTNPRVVITSATAGELRMDVSGLEFKGATEVGPAFKMDNALVATLALAAPTQSGSSFTWTDAVATLTDEGSKAFGGFYKAGEVLDPVTFTLPIGSSAAVTTTTLTATPSNPTVGDSVELTATVSPAAAGSVQFSNNGVAIGAPVAIVGTGGSAKLSTKLPGGANSLTATFIPADPTAFAGSTSAAQVLNVGLGALSTRTKLAVSPESPAVLGSAVALTATVETDNTSSAPTGTVEFFDGDTSIGSAALTAAGTAEFSTTKLAAGGHRFKAVFTSDNGFGGSESAAGPNYGVVDTAAPVACSPDSSALEFTDVSARWAYSNYSSLSKVASGNIKVSGPDFTLSGGVAKVSAECTSVSFTGSMRVEAYHAFFPNNGQWVELVDPVLSIDTNGDGVWSAGVRGGVGKLNTDTPVRTVVATATGAQVPDFTKSDKVRESIDFDYDGTTASGTWSVGRDSAWTNAFVMRVPAAVRAFYYASGASGDVTKSVQPLRLSWDWKAKGAPKLAATVQGAAVTEVKQGDEVVFTAESLDRNTDFEIEVRSNPVSLGTVRSNAVGSFTQSWVVPKDFAAGKHNFVVKTASGEVLMPFTVLAASTGGGKTPGGKTPGGKTPGGTKTPGGKTTGGTKTPGGGQTPGGSQTPGGGQTAQGGVKVSALSKTGGTDSQGALLVAGLALAIGAGSLSLARRRGKRA